VSKGTLKFSLIEKVPVQLIGRIAKFRAKDLGERKAAKASGRSSTGTGATKLR
jgi:hypothetical protein